MTWSPAACSNFSADAGNFSSPDTAVSTGHCYRYTFTSPTASATSPSGHATAKVDTVAPNTTIDSSPADPSEQHDAELHLQLDRGRLDLRVPHRQRQLDLLLEPGDDLTAH